MSEKNYCKPFINCVLFRRSDYTSIGALTNGTEYLFTLKAVYADGSKSPGSTALITPSDVIDAPLNVGAVTADGEVVLSWDEPAINNWFFVEITFTPVDLDVMQPLAVSVGTTSISITGLDNGTEYTFSLAATDIMGLYSTDVIISATPSLTGDVTPPANVSGVSSTVTPKGEVNDVLQYILYGEDFDPNADGLFDYLMPYMNLAGNPTNGICDVVWTDPVDVDYVETELILTRDSDSSSETVTVASGTETYRFANIVLGESYTLSARTRDDSNNWSASQDTAIITSAFSDITRFDVIFDPDGTPSKGFQYDYDYSVTDQLRMNWFVELDSDGIIDDSPGGDDIGCNSYIYTYNSENRLISFSSYVDTAQSQILARYDLSYNTDMTLQAVSANFDFDADGVIEPGETNYYIYDFNYVSGVLSEIDLNGIFPGGSTIYYKYTFTNNINGKPTQALLYFDAVDMTLDTNPTFKWDFTYDGNGRVSIVEKSSDTDLDATFTYMGKHEYVYTSGDLDSVPGYDNLNNKETEMDFIY